VTRILLYLLNIPYPTKNPEQYFKFLDRICAYVNIGFYVPTITAWQDGDYLPAITIAILSIIYYFSRLSVVQEIDIGRSLFPADRMPKELERTDRFWITAEVIVFMLSYAIVISVAHCILTASFFLLLIACVDFNTRRRINAGMKGYLRNPDYEPSPEERTYAVIMQHRTIAEWFLYELPHLKKEAGRVAGFALAFGIANYSYFEHAQNVTVTSYLLGGLHCAISGNSMNPEPLIVLSYAVTILTIFVNEWTTMKWRISRDRKLGRL
jgi:hypothetical protein